MTSSYPVKGNHYFKWFFVALGFFTLGCLTTLLLSGLLAYQLVYLPLAQSLVGTAFTPQMLLQQETLLNPQNFVPTSESSGSGTVFTPEMIEQGKKLLEQHGGPEGQQQLEEFRRLMEEGWED